MLSGITEARSVPRIGPTLRQITLATGHPEKVVEHTHIDQRMKVQDYHPILSFS